MTCERCKGVGWLEVDKRGQGTVQPCPLCNRESYERWATGAWSPKWGTASPKPADDSLQNFDFGKLRELLRRPT